jgi:hypothetical protein
MMIAAWPSESQVALAVVFGRCGSSAGAKKRQATTVVRGDETIFGPISGRKPRCNPSILEPISWSSEKHEGLEVKHILKYPHREPLTRISKLILQLWRTLDNQMNSFLLL